MPNRLKQLLAITLSFVLCVTGMPAAAVAEVAEATDVELATTEALTSPLEVLYRTHQPQAGQSDDEGWSSYTPQQSDESLIAEAVPEALETPETPEAPEAPETLEVPLPTVTSSDEATLSDAVALTPEPFTSLQMKTNDDTLVDAITYRLKALDGTWQDAWVTSPAATETAQGIAGVQAQLSDDVAATYDLWYRAQTDNGTWLNWVQAPNALESPELERLCNFQAVLTQKGEQPDKTSSANADQPQDESLVTSTDQNEEPLVIDDAPTPQNADELDQPEVPDKQDTAADIVVDENIKVQGGKADDIVVVDSNDKTADQSSPALTVQSAPTGIKAQASTKTPFIKYRANVQGIGWQSWVKNGTIAGTSGKSRQVNALRLKLGNATGGITYRAHVQGVGWQKWVSNGTLAGTSGKSRRMEAIKIKLTGSIANDYNVWYRTHVAHIGWQNWVKNGAMAGTTGKSLPIEAIEVLLVKKTGSIPVNNVSGSNYSDASTSTATAVCYQGYVTNTGWINEVSNGAVLGPANNSTPLESVRIAATGIDGKVQYRTYGHLEGWTGWKKNGALSGSAGKGSYLEAIRIKLLGNAKQSYDVYYRVYAQKVGWMAWTKNGYLAGTVGHGYRISALQVQLVKHGSAAPTDDAAAPFANLTNLSASYSANVRDSGWQKAVSQGRTAGTTGISGRITGIKANVSLPNVGSIRYGVCNDAGTWQSWKTDGAVAGVTDGNITALRFKLAGEATKHFDVWYRVHVAHLGWLGWTKNGNAAGTDSQANPIEAYEVRIQIKGTAAPGQTARPYALSEQLNGVDIFGWDRGINVANTDADFFIIKATEGVQGTIYNPWYSTWATEALNNGKLIGFYHYANGGDPLKEADSFYSAIQNYKGRAIACLDWEGQGNSLFGTGKDVAWCKKFLDRLKLRFGGTPLIYMSKSVTNEYDWSSVASSYPLWGAQYPSYDPIYGYQSDPWQSSSSWGAWGKDPLIFQYTSTGVLTHNGGIDYFDFNLFHGSVTDWRQLQS